ncbi:MAG: MerR family transcriptional regulator [Burkholderiaceae bacterium]|jgi:DNA-binding transcriptional MerR regulator|nr:MerR family transcriptional regulator [Burkholderiaceae bacterium]MCZ8174614.1 MerR family transcriptional regulator [Burkholderiaceae bacterium]
MSESPSPPGAPAAPADDPAQHEPRYRSGAVARMLRMPVATLRVWERRYQVSQPQLSPSGQRLYSAAQVQRLAQLKQLTDLGHAIGSLARLDMAQLRQVVDTHARTLSQAAGARVAEATLGPPALPVTPGAPAPRPLFPDERADAPSGPAAAADAPTVAARGRSLSSRAGVPPQAWRVVVVGKLLGQRLKGVVQQALVPPGRMLHLQGPFETLEEAAAEPLAATADALLVYAPSLQDEWLDHLLQAMPAWRGKPMAVLYGFASERTCRLFGRVPGLTLLRGPQSDAALAQWLRGWRQQIELPAAGSAAAPSAMPVPARRWDDEALASFAGLSTTIACECPRHVAELLVQLSHFEAYSADCESRSPEDAELHAYLHQVTALARAQFETALERVARHEGLLPSA